MRKKIIYFKIAGFVLLSVIFSGCASMFNGADQEVRINTKPDRAKVYINGDIVGHTPMTAELKRGKQYQIELKKNG